MCLSEMVTEANMGSKKWSRKEKGIQKMVAETKMGQGNIVLIHFV